jgi:hypothetical protein
MLPPPSSGLPKPPHFFTPPSDYPSLLPQIFEVFKSTFYLNKVSITMYGENIIYGLLHNRKHEEKLSLIWVQSAVAY